MPFRALSRLLDGNARTVDWLQLAAYLSIALVMAAGFYRIQQVNTKVCDTVNANREYIRGALERGIKALPTIAYYREHPDELQRVLAEQRQTLAELPPDPCS